MRVRQSKVVTNGERTSCGPSPKDLPARRTPPARVSEGRVCCLPWRAGRNQAGRGFRPAGESDRGRSVRQVAPLSERETRVLAFERHWWRQPGAKEQAISDQLELSATRYYQLLNELIDRPEAMAADPVLVKRLRRQRARRERIRSARAERRREGGAAGRARRRGVPRRRARTPPPRTANARTAKAGTAWAQTAKARTA